MTKFKEYALYKGEELLCVGTVKEIAEQQNIKVETVRFYLTPSNRKREGKSKNRKMLFRLEG